jgi:cytidylate kinase
LDISNNQDGSILILLDGENVSRRIRSPQVTQYVSEVAKIKGVREEMLKLQRSSAAKDNSVVDGRDIGTVVFPDAEKKFYLDAEFDQRLRRRFKELKATGRQVTKEAVEANLKNRDYIDSTREFAPLRKADDAVYIDTTNMTVNEAVQTILEKITGGVNNQ